MSSLSDMKRRSSPHTKQERNKETAHEIANAILCKWRLLIIPDTASGKFVANFLLSNSAYWGTSVTGFSLPKTKINGGFLYKRGFGHIVVRVHIVKANAASF